MALDIKPFARSKKRFESPAGFVGSVREVLRQGEESKNESRSLLALHLMSDEAGIAALLGQERIVVALLDELTLVDDRNGVGVPDRRQAVRHHDSRAAHHQPVQRILHDALALRVKRARRLVKKQDLRVLHNGPGNRHALLLAAGKLDAALA